MNTTAAPPTRDPDGSRVFRRKEFVPIALLVAIAFVLPYAMASTVVLSQASQEATQEAAAAASPSGDEVELSGRIDELNRRTDEQRRELLDYRANQLERWIFAVAIFITLLCLLATFLGILVAGFGVFGYLEFRAFRAQAEKLLGEIREKKDRAEAGARGIEEMYNRVSLLQNP